jgi:hypothetical protein
MQDTMSCNVRLCDGVALQCRMAGACCLLSCIACISFVLQEEKKTEAEEQPKEGCVPVVLVIAVGTPTQQHTSSQPRAICCRTLLTVRL